MKKLLLILVILLSALPVTALAQCDERYAYCTGGDEYDLGEASMGDDGFLGFDQDGLPVFKDPPAKKTPTTDYTGLWLLLGAVGVVGGSVYVVRAVVVDQMETRARNRQYEKERVERMEAQRLAEIEWKAEATICPECGRRTVHKDRTDYWCEAQSCNYVERIF